MKAHEEPRRTTEENKRLDEDFSSISQGHIPTAVEIRERFNQHWSKKFLKQEILSVSSLGEGSQHQLELVELANHSKWVCKQFFTQTWLGEIEDSTLQFTESIAATVAKRIGITFAAYREGDKSVFSVRNKRAIIIPYCEGQLLTSFTEQQAFILGGVLARLHCLKLPTDNGKPFPPVTLYDKCDLPEWLKELTQECNGNSCYQADQWVLSHRDIHTGNIIWRSKEKPHLLDWESTGLIHPTIELIGLAENCAGLAHCDFQEKNFIATLMGYGEFARKLPKVDAKLWRLSFHSWLLWYSYCLRQNWLEEACQTLEVIVDIKKKLSEMNKLYSDCYSFFGNTRVC
ncbi:protein of unknown function [Legionella micdadei]|uniref:Phosphotransferase enzyme family protein n=2 Tax=Legionella micdadei TaxID=451 RepID=A0A098GB24_LEGMI|nr:putative aminoglycoside phosphotransferase [Legionella micdadei]CEG59689.1 protein of unknown function [Legionella micdadei]SCX97435.1 Phosphotransferase enzyme family protein [Legionella micdadei]